MGLEKLARKQNNIISFILNNNLFEFNDETYRQTSSTAFGTYMAPPYSDGRNRKQISGNIWWRYIERRYFSRENIGSHQ